MITMQPGCLIMPAFWPRCLSVLTASAAGEDEAVTSCLATIGARNRRIARTDSSVFLAAGQPSQHVITLLDELTPTSDISALADTRSLVNVEDHSLVLLVLHWSVAMFRHRIWRIYAAVRLLRQWAQSGMDLNYILTSILGETESTARFSPRRMYCLMSELIRHRLFSIGKYLQWLLATGIAETSRGAVSIAMFQCLLSC
jgi:mediator of RNA polymerase II transcription subunit 12